MPIFELVLARTETKTKVVRVTAANEQEANHIGLELEAETDFTDGKTVWTDFEVNQVEAI